VSVEVEGGSASGRKGFQGSRIQGVKLKAQELKRVISTGQRGRGFTETAEGNKKELMMLKTFIISWK